MAYGTKKIHIRDRCPSGNIMLKHAAVYGAFGNPNEIRDSLNVASGVEKMQNIFNEFPEGVNESDMVACTTPNRTAKGCAVGVNKDVPVAISRHSIDESALVGVKSLQRRYELQFRRHSIDENALAGVKSLQRRYQLQFSST
eukprot:CAMPEP_0185795968 /NCGR_PEP_ID=MMETSP1174-20130828/160832_1 /TAXON_ID=35687 /ORGANISM="Dictyocha speculum, Strain CCMP1381" /LENGTH=141 /DNA_ID=CAMNT_0028491297 /DNA_START=530 /DNA_END=956 /DNA_ORIENTATION=-